MQINDKLYRAFLEEMQVLENFRMSYTGVHATIPLEREDPEVKRLIEAMAFFIARTRMSTQNNLLATRRRIFQQFFSFLLTPLPLVGVVQVQVSRKLAEKVLLPKHSEVMITANKKHSAIFRTLYDLEILPVNFLQLETLLAPGGGFRILLHFQATHPRTEELGVLQTLINHLNNYPASLHVFYNLQEHLDKVSIFFDEKVDQESRGQTCPVEFGSPLSEVEEANEDITHPLQKARLFFHYPDTELYMNITVPSTPASWEKFTLCLDLKKSWPKNLKLNREIFQFFTVPIMNIKQSSAQPILCDGMQERYALRYPDVAMKFELYSIQGVYEIAEDGLKPLRHGVLSGGSGSYEVEHEEMMDGEKRKSWLLLNFPEAFEDPRGIAADALWYQPWFSEHLLETLDLDLYDRHVEGASWELLGDLRAHQDNPLRDDFEGLLQILALQKKTHLNLEDLKILLGALGVFKSVHFKEVPSMIKKMEVSQVPHQENGKTAIKYIYQFYFREFDPSYYPLVEVFLKKVVEVLDIWTTEGSVAIQAEIPGMDSFKITGGPTH